MKWKIQVNKVELQFEGLPQWALRWYCLPQWAISFMRFASLGDSFMRFASLGDSFVQFTQWAILGKVFLNGHWAILW